MDRATSVFQPVRFGCVLTVDFIFNICQCVNISVNVPFSLGSNALMSALV